MMNTSRYIITAGLAASEVEALMTLQSIIAVATSVLPFSAVWFGVLLFTGLGGWLWWKRSMVAAWLMLGLVVFEYWDVAVTYERSNTWLVTYLCLFLLHCAYMAESRKRSSCADERPRRA